MKKQLMVLALVLSGTVQAAMIPWHWWTDAAGSNVDAAGNTWNVYYADGSANPSSWSAMSYDGTQWGSRPGYDSSKTLTANGYWNAPGVTLQAGISDVYSWAGSVYVSEYAEATVTFGKTVNGTWTQLDEVVVPLYSSYNLSANSALQNISLNAGDQLTVYVRKVGGGWVDVSMASAGYIPEPTALALLGLGGLVLLLRKR